MTTRRIVVVSAGLSQPSSTRLLADRLAAASVEALGSDGTQVQVETVELRDLAHEITDNLLTGFAGARLRTALDALTAADGVIAVSPVFAASFSGLFKSFFDVVDPKALVGTPVLLGATAGTARHSLALEHAMRPLFSYLRALTTPTAVFAAAEDWGTGAEGASGTGLVGRIERAAKEFAPLVRAHEAGPDLTDPFASLVPFAEQLGGR